MSQILHNSHVRQSNFR